MRILLLNQFFYPDTAPTSVLLTDVAKELVARGHQVTAVCGSSGYTGASQTTELPGVTIHRTATLKFAKGTAARLLSYASFLGSALWAGLTREKPDLVITLTTPPLLPLLGAAMKDLRGCRHWIWEMDVYPDVAVELGWLKRGSALERAIGALADWPRRRADGTLVLGECMKQRLMARGVDPNKLFVAENWADGHEIRPLPFPGGALLRIVYSGNLGLAHDVDTVKDVMARQDDAPVADFVFAGAGSARIELEAWSKERNLKHAAFRGYASPEDLGQSLGSGDIGLVTQRPESIGTVVPSKVYGLLAAGRPVLFIGPKGSTPHRIVERFRCGWQIDPGDSAKLLELLSVLQANRRLVYEAGTNARRAFAAHYDRPIGVARVAGLLGLGSSDSQNTNGIAAELAAS